MTEEEIFGLLYIFFSSSFLVVLIALFFILRKRIKSIMDCDEEASGSGREETRTGMTTVLQDFLPRIIELSGEIVLAQLRKESPTETSVLTEIVTGKSSAIKSYKPAEEELYEILSQVMKCSPEEKQYYSSVIRAFLKTNIISHPYDLWGGRRCYYVERVLHAVESSAPVPRLTSSKFSQILRLPWVVYTRIFTYGIGFSFGIWLYDIVTDIQVTYAYTDLMCVLDTNETICSSSIREWFCTGRGGNVCSSLEEELNQRNNSQHVVDMRIVSVLALHNLNTTIFLVISLLVSLLGNPVKKIARLLKVKLSMSCPVKEREMVELGTGIQLNSVLERYRLTLDEAGFETLLCMSLSVGGYMNLNYVLAEANLQEGKEAELLDSTLETVLKSTLMGILSLTFAQLKSHDTQHEYNTSSLQGIVFLLASLSNTISICLCFCSVYSVCMHFCSHVYGYLPGTSTYTIGYYICLICVCFIGLNRTVFDFATRRMMGKMLLKLEATDSPSYISKMGLIFNCSDVFQLPTANTHMFSYNYIYTPNILFKMARQCLGLIVFTGWSLIQYLVIREFYHFDPTLSSIWVNFLSVSAVGVPVGFSASYFFLWIYYKLDYGFFTKCNVQYAYQQREKKEKRTTNEGIEACPSCFNRIAHVCLSEGCGRKKNMSVAGAWKSCIKSL